jgi:hypothetical protein
MGVAVAGAERVPTRPVARRLALVAIPLCLFALTFFYRFASMGGTLGGFEDDEFVTLAYAQQMVLGDLPVRDFSENGSPLTHALSAAAIASVGPPLLAEAVLTMSMLGICTAILFLLAERASRSIPIALTVALLGIAIAPRFYNYPKLLAYAVALPAIWWYIDRPRRGRLFLVALAGVIAFLLRHDHGAYVAAASLVAVVLVHWPDVRTSVRELLVLGAMALALVAPYMAYTQLHGGAVTYLRAFVEFGRRSASQTNAKALAFSIDSGQRLFEMTPERPQVPQVNVEWTPSTSELSRAEAERALGLVAYERLHGSTWKYALTDWSPPRLRAIVTNPQVADTQGIDRNAFTVNDPLFTTPPSRYDRVVAAARRVRVMPGVLREANAVPFLYYTMLAIPIAALLLIATSPDAVRVTGWNRGTAKVAVTAVLALLMISGLLRGNLTSRFADVAEVIGVLAAWVAAVTLRRPSRAGRAAALAVALVMVVLTAASIQAIENVSRQIAQTRITSGIAAARAQSSDVYRQLSGTPPIERWIANESGIIGLAQYVHACTRPDDRVLAMAYVPQLLVLSARGFAGGVPWFLPSYFTDEGTLQRMVPRIHDHRVPLAITAIEPDFSADYVPSFPSVAALLANEYRDLGVVDFGQETRYNVFVRRDLEPSGSFGPQALPCFVG